MLREGKKRGGFLGLREGKENGWEASLPPCLSEGDF